MELTEKRIDKDVQVPTRFHLDSAGQYKRHVVISYTLILHIVTAGK